MHSRTGHVRARTVVALAIISTLLAVGNIWLSIRGTETSKPKDYGRSYSYLGDDFPEFFIPVRGELSQVAMVMEESRHYPIKGPNALDEWATSSSVGYGYVRLGPEYRGFALGMFHELHCLHVMRLVLGDNDTHAFGHFQHCLNYLRQYILCSPNLTLEPADVLTRDFETDRVGATHVCSDWSTMYDEMADNWWKWEPVKNSNGTVPTSGPT